MGLIELVIVLVIIGLVVAGAVGRVTWAAAAIGAVVLLLLLAVLHAGTLRIA